MMHQSGYQLHRCAGFLKDGRLDESRYHACRYPRQRDAQGAPGAEGGAPQTEFFHSWPDTPGVSAQR